MRLEQKFAFIDYCILMRNYMRDENISLLMVILELVELLWKNLPTR